MDSYLAYLRANLCRDGIENMRARCPQSVGRVEPRKPIPGDDDLHRGDSHTFWRATQSGQMRGSCLPSMQRCMPVSSPFAAVILAERCIVGR